MILDNDEILTLIIVVFVLCCGMAFLGFTAGRLDRDAARIKKSDNWIIRGDKLKHEGRILQIESLTQDLINKVTHIKVVGVESPIVLHFDEVKPY
jgi:hypothetical protein